MEPFFYHRKELAKAITSFILGDNPLEDYRSGMFLSGPRRTGKSEFLRRDLVPLLKKEGIEVVYADLWDNPAKDPSIVVRDALLTSIRNTRTPLTKNFQSKGGVRDISVMGVKVILDEIGVPSNESLTATIEALSVQSRKQVCLIIDEAQHSTTTESGRAMMYALKAAREHMNQRPELMGNKRSSANLMLIFTGSNRAKLADLTTGRNQAFYRAREPHPLPKLDNGYADAYCDYINKLFSKNNISPSDMRSAFSLLWNRPEDLASAVSMHFNQNINIIEAAGILRVNEWRHIRDIWNGLDPLQQAILFRLLHEENFSPYSEETLNAIFEQCGKNNGSVSVQRALEKLQESGLVWRADRGDYEFDSEQMKEWLHDQNDDFSPKTFLNEEGTLSIKGSVEALIEKGMTQTSLANMIDVTPKTLASWRKGMEPKSALVKSRIHYMYRIIMEIGLSWDLICHKIPSLQHLLTAEHIDTDAISLLIDGIKKPNFL